MVLLIIDSGLLLVVVGDSVVKLLVNQDNARRHDSNILPTVYLMFENVKCDMK